MSVKEEKLIYFLASGGDIYGLNVTQETGMTNVEAVKTFADQTFKKKVRDLQDEMHYESIRRIKAATPLAVNLLIESVTSKRGSASTASINAAKLILELSGVSGNVYEDEETLNPTDEELKALILSIPKALRHIDMGEDND